MAKNFRARANKGALKFATYKLMHTHVRTIPHNIHATISPYFMPAYVSTQFPFPLDSLFASCYNEGVGWALARTKANFHFMKNSFNMRLT